ncbi:MAG TPA: GAF domain-containing sensor histidine kinase [Longimicrobium sp.]|jgi:signal transduction histidine kinase
MPDGAPATQALNAPADADAAVLDRLARLACALTGARGALVLAFDGEATVVAGRSCDGVDPGAVVPLPGHLDEGGLYPAATLPLHDPGSGQLLGSLLLLDEGPREWGAGERAVLDDVAAVAAAELRWRRTERARRAAEVEHEASLERERQARGAAEAAEKRYAFLAEVSALLDASLDYHETFQKLARLAVPGLADYCLIDELEPDGGTRRIARAHVDPAKERLLLATTYNPPDADAGRRPVLQVVRSGLPVLVSDVTPEVLDMLAVDEEHRSRFQVIGLRSFMVAPLIARGRVLGTITLGATADSGRRYGAADLAHAEEVAKRAAIAIDNARLYGQAQQAIRAREAVLAVVSHDLRNPLASILLNATMVLDTKGLDPWVADSLEQVVDSVEQTNRLITDLLDVARMEENGGIPLDRAPVDARSLVASAVRLLAPIAAARGVSLEAEPGAPLPVLADSDRVVQVLSNLIGNAVKFTEPGGSVRVLAEPRGAEQWFAVADTGAGIDEEHLAHIFDRFWQVGRSDRRGVGLGLPIARGIVEGHGGRIWVESRRGEGTTVHFTLPAA